jgi:hypothetical protein
LEHLEAKYPFFSINKLDYDKKICSGTMWNATKRLKKIGFLRTYPRKENPLGKGRNDYDISGLRNELKNLAAALLCSEAEKPREITGTDQIYPHKMNSFREILKDKTLNFKEDIKK